ncbi:MMPL family transporter [Salana multivorans]
MVIVFGGALAAGMPIVGAVASIGAGLGSIWSLSYVMDLDSVVINVVTLLGLGLSIDYGLLMVSRFREELKELVDEQTAAITAGIPVGKRRRGGRRRDPLVVTAVQRTVVTAGRTVTFSALTIAICVAGLIAMSPSLLKGLGVAGSIIVLIALLTAITLVPALLMLSGRRFLRPSILSRVPGLRSVVGRLGDVAPRRGLFSALATWVQRYPWPVLLGCLALLVVAAFPIGSMHLRNSGIDALPATSPSRIAVDTIDERFPATHQPDIYVVPEDGNLDEHLLASISSDLREARGVDSVDAPVPLEDSGGHVLLGLRLDPGITVDSQEAVDIVRDLRELDLAAPVLIGGQSAGQLDFTDALVRGLPIAGGMVLLATFVLLFLMTGSVLVPLKALLTNAISIAASLGITTWVFQMGHGASLLGFEAAGGLESYVVAIVVAFGFGLAMDYEVFLIARIKELYDSGLSNNEAVVVGLQRSGRIITSAALVIIVVFAGFASGELLPIKEAGFALAVAVALDATIVRMLLVPATMTVLGDLNWWAPRWLRPLARRFAIEH